MNVPLTPELEEMVDTKVRTGQYASETEVVKEALSLLEKRDRAREDIRQKIEVGLESAQAGRMVDGEEFMAQMLAELDEEIRLEDEMSARELAHAQ